MRSAPDLDKPSLPLFNSVVDGDAGHGRTQMGVRPRLGRFGQTRALRGVQELRLPRASWTLFSRDPPPAELVESSLCGSPLDLDSLRDPLSSPGSVFLTTVGRGSGDPTLIDSLRFFFFLSWL